MPRQKGKKNAPQEVIDEIIRLHSAEGLSVRQLSQRFDMPFKTVKNMITRENKKKRQTIEERFHPKPGRPRAHPITTKQELELRVKQLEHEVELYRSFLQAAGRM